MIGHAVRTGVKVVKDVVELVDLEARGVQDVSALVRAVPRVPWRVARFVRDAVVVLAEMPAWEARPWRAFHARFTAVHGRTPEGRTGSFHDDAASGVPTRRV